MPFAVLPLLLAMTVIGLLPDVARANSAGPQPRALLVPAQETMLSSQMSGLIRKITVDEGGRFRKGQVLIALDCAENYAEEARAKAEVAAARAELDTQQRLAKLGSGRELDLLLATSALDKAKADLSLRRTRSAMCNIKAPFSGRLVTRHAQPYQIVDAGDPVLEILDDSKWRVHVIVPSLWLQWLKPGLAFKLSIEETGKTYAAKVTKIGARVDAASQSVKVIGEIAGGSQGLTSGMSGVARFRQ